MKYKLNPNTIEIPDILIETEDLFDLQDLIALKILLPVVEPKEGCCEKCWRSDHSKTICSACPCHTVVDKQCVPRKNEKYWFVSAEGEVLQDHWDDFSIDKWRLEIGNVHFTKKEAQNYKQWLIDNGRKV